MAGPRLLLVLGALIGLVALIPLFFVVGYVVSIGWDRGLALVWRPRVGELLKNTGLLVFGCVGGSAVLGTGNRVAGRAHHPARPGGSGTFCSWRRWPFRPSSTASAGSP
jgi:hypothetical protein